MHAASIKPVYVVMPLKNGIQKNGTAESQVSLVDSSKIKNTLRELIQNSCYNS